MIADRILYNSISLYELIHIIFIFLIAVIIIKMISLLLKRALREKVSRDRLKNMLKIINYLTFVILILSVLPILGINPSGLLVAGGLAAIVIGFASQSIFTNLISGIFLVIERPIKFDDIVNIDGQTGLIEEIRIISTTLRTFDGVFIRIPNEKVFTNSITNYLVNPVRRFEYTLGIRYKDDAEKAVEIIRDVINEHPLALVNPSPQVFVSELNTSSVDIKTRIWAPSTDWYQVKMELLWKIKSTLEEQDIKVPFPQREVWFNNELKTNKRVPMDHLKDR